MRVHTLIARSLVVLGLLAWHDPALGAQSTVVKALPSTAAPPGGDALGEHGRARDTQVVSPLDRVVSLHLSNVRLQDALDAIDRQAKLGLAYTRRVVPFDKRVSLRADHITAGAALAAVLQGTDVRAVVMPSGTVVLRRDEEKPAKVSVGTDTVWGRVVDSTTALPIAAAMVTIADSSVVVNRSTNDDGYYILPGVPAGSHVVHVRHIGYLPAARPIVVADGAALRLDVALHMGMTRLQDVVTTASGPRRRLELGNDITIINADSIARTQPVSTVTDLLEGRVPGLVVERSSGAPGDPAFLRLRGSSSPTLSNDPIVVVDGVRVYAATSDARGRNLSGYNGPTYAAPSPIDQIDPHNIETIEVMKGPSAATLYGADAANGVIVITTKRGQSGPPRWTASVERGMTEMPAKYPDMYVRWGHPVNDPGTPILCPLVDTSCLPDSLVRFQTLNDPTLTILGHGNHTGASLGVSGGSDALQYNVGGNFSEDLGLVRLPGIEVDRYRASHGTTPPDWMRHPQQYRRWGANTRLTAKLGRTADVSLMAMLTHGKQQRSSLEGQLLQLMATYVDRTTGTYYRSANTSLTTIDEMFANYYTRVTDDATQSTNGLNVNWRPRTWLTGSVDAGLNVVQREDESLLPRGAITTSGDSVGRAGLGHGTSVVSTVNARATATVPLPRGIHFQAAMGANYTNQRTTDVSAAANDLASASVQGARQILTLTDTQLEQATFGWYIEPSINTRRLWLSTGLRLDGGNAFGSSVKLIGLPKVSASYLISDEPWFPFKSAINTLRLRAAYGQAGVQPGPSSRLRLYSAPTSTWVDGRSVTGVDLTSIGNTKIKPERSTEIEGGFDADLFDDRLSLGVSGYRKTRVDALVNVPFPPSVYGGGTVLQNIGTIRNTGYELTLGTQLVRADLVSWSAQLQVSHNRNVVVDLGPNVQPFGANSARVVEGYPLFSRWGKPVLAYTDRNGDGKLEENEILYGDSLVYLGSSEPDYTAGLSTTFSLFRGAVDVTAGFTYTSGMAQVGPWRTLAAISRGANDSTASFAEQAAILSAGTTDYLNVQTVNTLRFNSLSVAYNVPARVAQRLGARALAVAVQGTNLGLHTDYRGMDPNVNGGGTQAVIDTGVLPLPRTWQLRVSASY
jgi:TonB-linked SusC/RagA family outer membrane protein